MKIQIHDNTIKHIDSTLKSAKVTPNTGEINDALFYQLEIVNKGLDYVLNKRDESRHHREYKKYDAMYKRYDKIKDILCNAIDFWYEKHFNQSFFV